MPLKEHNESERCKWLFKTTVFKTTITKKFSRKRCFFFFNLSFFMLDHTLNSPGAEKHTK